MRDGQSDDPGVDSQWPEPLLAIWDWLRRGVEDIYDPRIVVAIAGGLERIHRSISATQAALGVRLRELRLAEREELVDLARVDGSSVPPSRRSVERSVAGELAMSRRQAPRFGSASLKLAEALLANCPCTLAALREGLITEAMARIVVTETQTLTPQDRQLVDLMLADRFSETLSEAELRALVRGFAFQLDQRAALARRQVARSQRRVTCRPLADGMARLSAEIPTEDAVSMMAELRREADASRADPLDQRGRGQVMADELVERVTGCLAAEHDPEHAQTKNGPTQRQPVELRLLMPLDSTFEAGETPALLNGEPLPAYAARDLICDPATRVTLRRLFTHPATGQVIGMDSIKRLFTGGLRELVSSRDLRCRNPFCGAPIRHVDHVQAFGQGGGTSFENAQGLCEYCNYLKEAPGWSYRIVPSRHVGAPPDVELITPTGQTLTSMAPRLVPTSGGPRPPAA